MPINVGSIEEESSGTIVIGCTDEDGAAVTPKIAWWSLLDEEDAIINGRSEIAFSPLASTLNLPLSPAETILPDHHKVHRWALVHLVYDSTYGLNRERNQNILFSIENVHGIT